MAISEEVRIQDVVKWEVDPRFTRDVVTLKTATAQVIVVGSPLRDNTGYILVANGQEANATHIALENISATGDEKILTLARGPALIDKDRLTLATDVAWSELAAYYAARDIRPLSEPEKLEEGTA